MFKIETILILLFSIFRKMFGLLWFWVVFPLRHNARNKVYNYVLQNKLWLKRLYERTPTPVYNGWILIGGRAENGFVRKCKVNKFEYLLWYWLVWIWVDDDSNYDFADITFTKTILDGEREFWISKLFGKQLLREYQYLQSCKFGNTFELGDKRAENPVLLRKCPISAMLWLMRNTAYNAKYAQFTTIKASEVFVWRIFGWKVGWFRTDIVGGKQVYELKIVKG